jgi:hypothetical protein
MPRNIFGYKKVVKIDKHSNTKYSESDIRWEKFKIVIWILLGALYMYYIIQPQNWKII